MVSVGRFEVLLSSISQNNRALGDYTHSDCDPATVLLENIVATPRHQTTDNFGDSSLADPCSDAQLLDEGEQVVIRRRACIGKRELLSVAEIETLQCKANKVGILIHDGRSGIDIDHQAVDGWSNGSTKCLQSVVVKGMVAAHWKNPRQISSPPGSDRCSSRL